MAGKRFFNESESDKDLGNETPKRTRVSLRSVVGEAVMLNSLQNIFTSLEPLLRRVVSEEVEGVLRVHCTLPFSRSPSLRIQALEPSNLKLAFPKGLQFPIFTGSKIQDIEGNGLKVLLVDKSNDQNMPICLSHPIKVEIVVLDGDFPKRDDSSWTSTQFDKSILKERVGKRPLLHGDLNLTLRDGSAVIGDIEFTDNSSWIRSRKFRIGARIVPGSNSKGLSVGEAMTEAFVVKDHRGELYKKHYPPKLEDDVWRLEKIGKDGAFHKKLFKEGIKTVQDFLKLSVIEPQKLKKFLGVGMSEKMWEVTLRHAMTCSMDNKRYIYRGNQMCLTLSPICQVTKAEINGQIYSIRDITNNKSYFEGLVRDAYAKWNTLEVVDAFINEAPLLTQGNMVDQSYPNHHHDHDHDHQVSGVEYYPLPTVPEEGFDWMEVNSPYLYGAETGNRPQISEASSDGDFA